MKAKDLRIGNFVWVDNKEYHPELVGKTMVVCGIEKLRADERGKVQMNHVDDMENITLPAASQFEQFLKPIPITEDWLIKFGFDKAQNGWWDKTENFSLYKGFFRNGTDEIIECRYIHELQNIYFAFTGQELEFKQI